MSVYVENLKSCGGTFAFQKYFTIDLYVKVYMEIFPDMPYMKRVYRDKKATAQWSAARNVERSRSR